MRKIVFILAVTVAIAHMAYDVATTSTNAAKAAQYSRQQLIDSL